MDEVTPAVRTATRPVPIGELLQAWLALQRGDFHHPHSTSNTPAGTPRRGWTPAPGEAPILVVGCASGVGASTLALLLAAATASGRVVECGPASRSGLAGASTAELGPAGDGWLRGRRDDTGIQRRTDNPTGPDEVPPPLPGQPGRAAVIDAGWELHELLAADGWLGDLARTCRHVVLVGRASIPGVARLEACLARFDPERCWAVLAGTSALPKPVDHALGPRTRQLREAGRLHLLPANPGLAMSGITTEPFPRPLLRTAHTILEGLLQ
jgi:hypothetical protein